MMLNLWFYHQLWVKCIHIRNSSGYIGQTHSRFPNVCGCLTLTEMHIGLTFFVICSINYNLTNTLLISPPEVKNSIIYSVRQKKLPFIENVRIKSLTCLKHQINITVALLFCGMFF